MTRLSRSLAALAAFAVALGLFFAGAVSASAVTASGHGVGFTWAADGASWIGSYRLADGSLAFCLQAGKAAPTGHDYRYVDGTSLGWFSPDDEARLAFFSRTWGDSADPLLAASGQLATWTVAGLGGRTQEQYAVRANDQADEVMHKANDLLTSADLPGGASRSVTADVSLSPAAPEGKLTVSTGLTVDYLATGPTPVAPGTHEGTLTLTGAVFADGSDTMTVSNGTSYDISADTADPLSHVTAEVSFDKLPYGSAFRVGLVEDSVQSIMVAGSSSVHGSASTSLTTPSSLPFQPQVVTTTSDTVAEAGAKVSDELVLSARPDAGTLSEWGVYEPDFPELDAYAGEAEQHGGTRQHRSTDERQSTEPKTRPIPVVVESSLLGPFPDPIVPAESAPADAPVVCTVEVEATEGPGSYRTPECTLPSAGDYVWVERIDAARTPVEKGGDRIRPWQSSFGTATEVTTATTPPPPPVEETTPPTAPPVAPAAPPVVPEAPAALEQPVLAETGLPVAPLGLTGGLGASVVACGVLFLRRAAGSGIRTAGRDSSARSARGHATPSPGSTTSEPRAS